VGRNGGPSGVASAGELRVPIQYRLGHFEHHSRRLGGRLHHRCQDARLAGRFQILLWGGRRGGGGPEGKGAGRSED